jgi:hypothetical protein
MDVLTSSCRVIIRMNIGKANLEVLSEPLADRGLVFPTYPYYLGGVKFLDCGSKNLLSHLLVIKMRTL